MSQPFEINPKKSQAIVASAGTGKTYTLERVVLKLLLAKPHELIQPGRRMSIDELVLVTFTDKAAGELKERIRLKIEDEILRLRNEFKETSSTDTLEDILHLEENLNKVDQSNISTIHGFCLKVLKTFAFESKSNFGLDLIRDDLGIRSELRRFLRQDSFNDCGKYQDKLWKELTQYLVKDEDKFLKLAKLFLSGNIKSPEGYEGQIQDLIEPMELIQQELKIEFQSWYDEFHPLVDSQGVTLQAIADYIESGTDEDLAKSASQKVLKGIHSIQEFHQKSDPVDYIRGLAKLPKALFGSVPKPLKSFKEEITELKSAFQLRSEGKEAVVTEMKNALKLLVDNDPNSPIKPYALTYAASQITKRWQKKKSIHGQISFDDMIEMVSEALESPQGLLKAKLQEVFRYGIIDEFQDTDEKQWGIFKSIFLDSPNHVIYVVGDRKQSIYKFRGSDLNTFDHAIAMIEAKDMLKAHVLTDNYRSTPEMIASYNRLFSTHTEKNSFFHKGSTEPFYEEVGCGFSDKTWPVDNYKSMLHEGSAHFYVHIEAESSPSLYRQYAQSVASHLIQLIQDSQKSANPIQANQIAVLYQSRARSREIREELERFNLPCAIYKEEGVFQSKAAFEWILLMEALSSRQTLSHEVKKACLTWFLRVKPEVLSDTKNWSKHPSIQKALKELEKWRQLVSQSQWGVLFEAILRQSQVMNFILEHEDDPDRVTADLHQVMEWMINYLASNQGTWRDLILTLRGFYHQTLETSQDQNYFALKSESEAVQFMTMHSSKGLEFPIVINVLSANDNNSSDGYRVVQMQPGQTEIYWNSERDLIAPEGVTDSQYDQTVKSRFYQERDEERARLYYVAMTRASLFQYIPVFCLKGKYNWPYDVFAQAAEDYIPNDRVSPEDYRYQSPLSNKEIFKIPNLTQNREQTLRAFKQTLKLPFQTSYSDLAHGQENHKYDPDDEAEHSTQLGYTPEDRKLIAAQTTLTPGNKTGDLLHNLFEHSNWQEVMKYSVEELQENLDFSRLLDQELKSAGLWTSEKSLYQQRCIEATSIIKHTLECPIQDLHSEFRLGDLEPQDVLPEMEFQFSFGPQAELFDENSQGGGWVKGFMDLVFRRPINSSGSSKDYRYYVLDWKSNALMNYSQEEISQSMQDSHYDVQARLYQLAMHEWLSELIGKEYSPEQHLGGAIYAYVRGNRYKPEQESFLSYPVVMNQVMESKEEFMNKLQHHKKFQWGKQS